MTIEMPAFRAITGLDHRTCGPLVADKGYDSDALRLLPIDQDVFPCLGVSRKRVEKRFFHRGYYRHHVENFFAKLKRHRRVSTRYDKLASSFHAFITLSSILHWLA